MTPTEARALAGRLAPFATGGVWEGAVPPSAKLKDEAVSALRSLADQVEELQGQALSSVEREEYFAMKAKAGHAQTLLGALADIAYSPDMTLKIARAKAGRVYTATVDRLRTENATLRELVREAYEKADLGWLGTQWDERAAKALGNS